MMDLPATAAVRYVAMADDQWVLCWRAALRLLLLNGQRDDAGEDAASIITLAGAGADGEDWTNTSYDEVEKLCVLEPELVPARAG